MRYSMEMLSYFIIIPSYLYYTSSVLNAIPRLLKVQNELKIDSFNNFLTIILNYKINEN